jgi:AraC family transcriptional regulator
VWLPEIFLTYNPSQKVPARMIIISENIGAMTMQPKFIELPEKKVVGLGAKFISVLSPKKNKASVIPQLWHQFVNQMGNIKHQAGGASFGLVEMLLETADKSHKDEMFYIAAAEVTDFDSVPAGMIQRVIPAGKYASFTHKGKLDGLEQTMKQIYVSWLPKSGIKLRNAPHLELYDQRFNLDSDQSEFDILLPVQ